MTSPPDHVRAADDQRWPFLPHLLFDMAKAFNLKTALAFARRYGGTYLSVPLKADPEHPIAGVIGLMGLGWLVKRHGGERIVVPRGPDVDRAQRRRAVYDLTAQGRTANEIAELLHLHVRMIHRDRAAAEAEIARDRQIDLFGAAPASRRA